MLFVSIFVNDFVLFIDWLMLVKSTTLHLKFDLFINQTLIYLIFSFFLKLVTPLKGIQAPYIKI